MKLPYLAALLLAMLALLVSSAPTIAPTSITIASSVADSKVPGNFQLRDGFLVAARHPDAHSVEDEAQLAERGVTPVKRIPPSFFKFIPSRECVSISSKFTRVPFWSS